MAIILSLPYRWAWWRSRGNWKLCTSCSCAEPTFRSPGSSSKCPAFSRHSADTGTALSQSCGCCHPFGQSGSPCRGSFRGWPISVHISASTQPCRFGHFIARSHHCSLAFSLSYIQQPPCDPVTSSSNVDLNYSSSQHRLLDLLS